MAHRMGHDNNYISRLILWVVIGSQTKPWEICRIQLLDIATREFDNSKTIHKNKGLNQIQRFLEFKRKGISIPYDSQKPKKWKIQTSDQSQ